MPLMTVVSVNVMAGIKVMALGRYILGAPPPSDGKLTLVPIAMLILDLGMLGPLYFAVLIFEVVNCGSVYDPERVSGCESWVGVLSIVHTIFVTAVINLVVLYCASVVSDSTAIKIIARGSVHVAVWTFLISVVIWLWQRL